MKTGPAKLALLSALILALALGMVAFLSGGPPSDLPIVTRLGTPGPHKRRNRLPNLAMELRFAASGKTVIARQEDGAILAWDIAAGTSRKIAWTEGAFDYCAAKGLLLVGDAGLRIVVEAEGEARRPVPEANADHAAWNGDCSRFALAEREEQSVEIRRTRDFAVLAKGSAERPPRNGLALSPDGGRVAVAAGSYKDRRGHRTRLEIFAPSASGALIAERTFGDDATILGIWKTRFLPGGQRLAITAQVDGEAGLRLFSASAEAPIWRKDGFASYWVRALAVSPDGLLLATGDEKGWLRLWNTANGGKLGERQAGLVIQDIAFSPDGAILAVALWDGTIAILRTSALMTGG